MHEGWKISLAGARDATYGISTLSMPPKSLGFLINGVSTVEWYCDLASYKHRCTESHIPNELAHDGVSRP
jgi:hypothetical protein